MGASVLIPTLTGPLNIKIPAGSQNGQRLRLRARGLPGRDSARGNLYVQARIQMPAEISEREKALLEQLASASSFNPRKEKED